MDAVAYPQSAVIEFINANLVPLRIPADDPQLGSKFRVKWTPTLLILDADGVEHYRTLGFFSPEELIPSLLLGMGKASFNRAERPAACNCLERLINEFPKSFQVPEAIYLHGVARYIESHDVSNLIGIYDQLSHSYPNDQWAMRADPYRLLKK
jgi:hypothetical protein